MWLTALGVGACLAYVGAHLPNDVAVGVFLGIATTRGVDAVTADSEPRTALSAADDVTPGEVRH
jgi:membrane-associated phospholipid phosphatase